jgi:hypothetical protein
MTKMKWLGAALLAVATLAGTAQALTANLNIDVNIVAAKSVTVNGVASSTPTALSWNGVANQQFASVPGVSETTSTVQNTSGILSEAWNLSTSQTNDESGGGNVWAISGSTSSVGLNQFAVQAVFGSSNTASGACPVIGSGDWNNATFAVPLTAALQQYVANGVFADSSLNAGGAAGNLLYNPDNGNNMLPVAANGSGSRALCWRVIMPSAVTSSDNQMITILVTAN